MRELLLCALLTGCAAPRVITHASMTESQAKFIYNGPSNGIISCAIEADGTLASCDRLPITFQKRTR
jgi:hypothetical protein